MCTQVIVSPIFGLLHLMALVKSNSHW